MASLRGKRAALLAAPLLLAPWLMALLRPVPRLACAAKRHDFGEVLTGETVGHVFRLTNAGSGRLEVREVKASCSCVTPAVVPAGDALELRVRLSTGKAPTDGEETVTLETNDPVEPSHVFTLHVKSRAALEVSPSSLDFGTLRPSGAAPWAFDADVRCPPEVAWDVAAAVVDPVEPSPVRIDLAGTGEPGLLKLRLAVAEGSPAGPLTASVRFTFGGRSVAPVEHVIRGAVYGPVRASPAELFFGVVPASAPPARRAQITAASPGRHLRPFIRGVFGSLRDGATARVVSEGGKDYVEITPRPAPGRPAGAGYRGVVQVDGGDGSGARVDVPVLWSFR